MTKKYDSQGTIETVLAVAATLFLEKGYEKTSIQNIADSAGISKGAIYHHFKSKEEIITAVTDAQTNAVKSMIETWLSETDSLNGKDKLISILEKNLSSQEAHFWDEVMSTRMKSAEFVLTYMQNCVNQDSALISNIIRQGINDGSLVTDYPDECAEVFLLLLNVWCDPSVFRCDMQKLSLRLRFLQHLMKSMGIDVMSDMLFENTLSLIQRLYWKENEKNE